MEDRVATLEQQMQSIDMKLSKLPSIETQIAELKSQIAMTAKATDLAEIKGQLSQMPKANDWASLRAEIAEIKGKVSAIPTTWQLVPLLLTTWTAGAAIVFALLRVSGKTP